MTKYNNVTLLYLISLTFDFSVWRIIIPNANKCNKILMKSYNKRSSQVNFKHPLLYITRYTITIQFLKCISSFRTSSHQCKHNTFYLDTTEHRINVVLMAFHLLILNYLIVVQKGLNWKINWRQGWQFSSQYFKLVPLFIFCCRPRIGNNIIKLVDLPHMIISTFQHLKQKWILFYTA